MQRQFEQDLDLIRQEVLKMAGLAEQSLDDVAKILITGDPALAEAVIAREEDIDACDVVIDRLATEFIVRHQPMASDLRFVIVAIKIGPGLERIGDNTVNITRYLSDTDRDERIPPIDQLPRIIAVARAMVADAIGAYVARDAAGAREVIRRDEDVDRLYWEAFHELLDRIPEDPSVTRQLISQILVARFAERIGDQATNIAEEVIYLVEGEPVRHTDLDKTPAEE
jgi:phosphate transport system protein